MNTEQVEAETPAAPKPSKPRRKQRARRPRAPQPPKPPSIFAGIGAQKCPTGCMKDGICLISTVNVCKHPYMSGDAGCGPVTMANRREAMKILKKLKIDLTG